MLRLPFLVGMLCLCAPAQIESPAILFPETSYDFGTVKQGTKILHHFMVKNNTSSPVTVLGLEFSMPGMTGRFRPLILSGVDSGLTIEWDTTHLAGATEGRAIVHFGDASQLPVALRLKGIVQPPIEILPLPAIFLSEFQGEGIERRLKIINHQEQPTVLSLPQVSSKHFTAMLSEIERGRVYEVIVKIPPSVAPGHYDEELSVSTNDSKLDKLTIPVHLFVKPDLYANPDSVDFGLISADRIHKDHALSERFTQTFLVRKRDRQFAITKITSDVEGLVLTKDPPQGHSSTYRIEVTLDPQRLKVGKLEGFIKIGTDDRDFPEIKIPVVGRVF